MPSPAFDQFFRAHRQRLEALFESSGGARWSVTLEEFARAAWEGIARPASVDASQIPQLLDALRVKDLALALGCARGDESAWDTFLSQYRATLYEAAAAFTHDDTQARELADSLLAELYGLDASGGGRRSRFAYFHGRSSLKTWSRAVLYQEFVDEYRRRRRLEPIPEGAAEPASAESALSENDERHYDACLSEAVESALGGLSPPDKLLLCYYYVQQLTLREIGRLRGEHEATVSRHLETLRRRLRKRIEGYLRHVRKLTAFEIDRCLDFAARGLGVELDRILKPE